MRRPLRVLLAVALLCPVACGPMTSELPDEEWSDPNLEGGADHQLEEIAAPLSFDTNLKEALPPGIKILLDKAAEISGIVSQFKAAYGLAKMLGSVMGITGGSAGLSPEFAALHAELNRVGSVLSEQNRQILRDGVEAVFEAALRNAQTVADQGRVLEKSIDYDAEKALLVAAKPSMFERYQVPRGRKQHWELSIQRASGVNGMVYDWRGAFPTFLLYAAIRTAIMAASEPSFAATTTFDRELADIRRQINGHLSRMIGGVKCASRPALKFGVHYEARMFRGIPVTDVGVAPFVNGNAKDIGPEQSFVVVTCVDLHTEVAVEHFVHGRTGDPEFGRAVENLKTASYNQVLSTLPTTRAYEILSRLEALERGL